MNTSPEAKQAADVDKIAREAVIKLQDSCIQIDPRIAIAVLREAIDAGTAKLREEKVADKERLDWLAENIIDGVASIRVDKAFTHQGNLPELLREAIDAALTGTGWTRLYISTAWLK